jgi:hypothetical protein
MVKHGNHISEDGREISLLKNERFIVMDAMYLDEVRASGITIDYSNFIQEVKHKVFIYNKIPAAGMMSPDDGIMRIEWIRNVDYEEVKDSDESCFCTDTGLLLFIKEDLLQEFTLVFEREHLFDFRIGSLHYEYIQSLLDRFPMGSIGIVLEPGLDTGYDFTGSGCYRLEIR